jgi:hypothetical protein
LVGGFFLLRRENKRWNCVCGCFLRHGGNYIRPCVKNKGFEQKECLLFLEKVLYKCLRLYLLWFMSAFLKIKRVTL